MHVSNVENIPYNKPLVIAANHPGAFLDPVLIACLIRKPIYFLVRGDVFKNKLIRWIFEQFNMLPVYRKDEGFGNIEKNHNTNSKVADVLHRNGIVVIFCEGYSATNRRLRTVLKGTARVCMDTAVAANIDVKIIPAGISYTHKTNFRKSVMLDFSAPISMLDYVNLYHQHPQKSFVSITAELTRRLEQNFVIIKNEELDNLTETHLNYLRNNERYTFLPLVVRNNDKLYAERLLCEKIHRCFEENPIGFRELKTKTDEYETALKTVELEDRFLVKNPAPIRQMVLLTLGFPFFILGFMAWGIPYIISKAIADKKVTRIDFHDSLTVNATTFLFGVMVFLLSILGYFIFGWYTILCYFILPPSSIIAGWHYDMATTFAVGFKPISNRSELINKRNQLLKLQNDLT